MSADLWTLLVERGWGAALLRGGLVTISIGAFGLLLGLLAAAPLAVVRWKRVPLASPAIASVSLVVRSTPGLLVIYLLFFGSVQGFERVAGAFGFAAAKDAYPFFIGLLSVAAISCAYAIEVLRGALDAVPRGIGEAADALALPKVVSFVAVVAPLALRNALGGLNNVWQMTIKDTSLVSVVGLQEIMRVAAIASGLTRSALTFYVIAALMYFAMTGISQFLFARLERRLARGFGG